MTARWFCLAQWCVLGAAARCCGDPVPGLSALTAPSWLTRHRWQAMMQSKLVQQIATAVHSRSQDAQRFCLPSTGEGRQSRSDGHVQGNASMSMLTADVRPPGRGSLPGVLQAGHLGGAHTRQALVVHLAGATGGAPASLVGTSATSTRVDRFHRHADAGAPVGTCGSAAASWPTRPLSLVLLGGLHATVAATGCYQAAVTTSAGEATACGGCPSVQMQTPRSITHKCCSGYSSSRDWL